MSKSSLRRLPIVATGEQLSGKHPRGFERLARSCKAGDPSHAALLNAAATIARRGLSECLPPTVRSSYQEALKLVLAWCNGNTSYGSVRDARADLFRDVTKTETVVQSAMAGALDAQSQADPTALDPHAELVVRRYLGLCVHHAAAAVILVLDSISSPNLVLEVPGEVAGAVAYRQVAFGPARHPDLRKAALSQATWEHRRIAASGGHSEAALSVQLFHEYLGVHWKNHVDAQRLYLEEFISWAFAE